MCVHVVSCVFTWSFVVLIFWCPVTWSAGTISCLLGLPAPPPPPPTWMAVYINGIAGTSCSLCFPAPFFTPSPCSPPPHHYHHHHWMAMYSDEIAGMVTCSPCFPAPFFMPLAPHPPTPSPIGWQLPPSSPQLDGCYIPPTPHPNWMQWQSTMMG